MTFDVFHELRTGGHIMCEASGRQAWLEQPLAAAEHNTQAMLTLLGATPDMVERSVYNSLVADSLVSGLWAACGFPTITMGHRTAAELMATKIRPEDAREFVRAPWPAFAIRVPTPLLVVEDDGRCMDAPLILAACIQKVNDNLSPEPRWWFKLYTASPRASMQASRYPANMRGMLCSMNLWGFNIPTSYLAEKNPRDAHPDVYERWDSDIPTSRDERSEQLSRALIVGCCLQLAGDPRERAEGFTVKTRPSKHRPGDTLPPLTSVELQSSIRINLHHAMRDYVAHGGRAPSVRSLVAGHWKRQAHGEHRALRKLIHVQPYWRGDPDQPVGERTK